MRVVVLAGGFGGARMAHGFALEAERRASEAEAATDDDTAAADEPLELTVVGNTADDLELHGLHVSPDLDTVMYTLAGLANPETGWGVRDETWSASAMLERYGQQVWFRLGDRDLATHIVRSARLRAGERLTTVTLALCAALGVNTRLLPVTDDRLRTSIRTADGWLEFQDYFVRRQHADEVLEIRFDGVDEATPTAEVTAAVEAADLIVIAPSNPFVSVGPILALAQMADALHAAAAPVIAVSPIVGGVALRGPAAQMLRSHGLEPTAAAVARLYAERYPGLVDVFVLDATDADEADAVHRTGIQPLTLPTVMTTESGRRRLAQEILAAAATAG